MKIHTLTMEKKMDKKHKKLIKENLKGIQNEMKNPNPYPNYILQKLNEVVRLVDANFRVQMNRA